MKSYSIYGLLVTLTLASVMPFSAHAGGGSDGGGNLEEIDFKYRSTDIEKILTTNAARISEILGADAAALVNAIQSTNSECAKGSYAEAMTKENKLFWFDSAANTIFLDCSRYFSAVNGRQPELVKGLILHEYARKAAGESSTYQVSRHAKDLFAELAKVDTSVHGDYPERFARIFNIAMTVGDYAAATVKPYKDLDLRARSEHTQQDVLNRVYCFKAKPRPPGLLALISYSVADSSLSSESQRPPKNISGPEFFVHSGEDRCKPYLLQTYANEPGMAKEINEFLSPEEIKAGYAPSLPQIRAEYLKEKMITEKVIPDIDRLRSEAIAQLSAIAHDSTQTPLDRSLAVATQKVLQSRATTTKLLNEIHYVSGRNEKEPNEQNIAALQGTIAYLGFLAADHLHMTGNDLNVYREFNLEVEVRDLNDKVNYAIEMAERALDVAETANDKANSLMGLRRQDMVRSAAFWGVAGTFAWILLAP